VTERGSKGEQEGEWGGGWLVAVVAKKKMKTRRRGEGEEMHW